MKFMIEYRPLTDHRIINISEIGKSVKRDWSREKIFENLEGVLDPTDLHLESQLRYSLRPRTTVTTTPLPMSPRRTGTAHWK